MPEQPDNQTGRMLFTEFDVSGKGRPVAVLPEDSPPDFIPLPLHTIMELASSLEFDFEDDDGDAEPLTRGSPPAEDASAETGGRDSRSRPAHPDFPGGGEAFPEPDHSAPSGREYVPPVFAAAPTWEEYTKAFHSVREQSRMDAAAMNSSPAAPSTLADSDAVDSAAPTAAYVVVGDDDGEDILSALAIEDLENGDATRVLPRGRPVSEPPARPYGGVERIEDWFEPPENQPEAPASISDWYEPPEKGAATDAVADFLHSDLFAVDDAGAARPADPSPPEDKSNDDGMFDIFSGVDIDALWQERLGEAGAAANAAATDTRTVDFFSDIDLDMIWRERLGGNSDAGKTDRFRKVENAASAINPSDTVILAGGIAGAVAGTDAINGGNSRTINSDADLDFLEELPPPGEQPGEPAGDGFRPAGSAPARPVGYPDGVAGKESGRRDAMAGVDPGMDEAAAPGVSAAGQEDAPRPEASAADSSFLNPESTRDAGDEWPEDLAVAAAEGGAPEDGGPEVRASHKKRGLIADDLLDIDFGDVAVNSAVVAPVIDDSAIDSFQSRGPRPGTEEMRAIADGEAAAPVNPMDVFANMDDMDFSDDMDDDMRAMLDDEESGEEGGAAEPDDGAAGRTAAAMAAVPESLPGKVRYYLARGGKRILPVSLLERLDRMVAWHDNWWFYCDLLAAIIASASLAVIISYYAWYRI